MARGIFMYCSQCGLHQEDNNQAHACNRCGMRMMTPNMTGMPNGSEHAGSPPASTPAAPSRITSLRSMVKQCSQNKGIIITVICACLLLAAYSCYALLAHTVFAPRVIADEYLTAIAKGDYATATELGKPNLTTSQQILLSNRAAKSQSARISEPRVTSMTRESDGTYTIGISYELNRKTYDDSIAIARSGSQYLLFNKWTIIRPLLKQLTFNAPTAHDNFVVNDVHVSTHHAEITSYVDDSRTMAFTAYPGTYTVKADTGKYFNTNELTIHLNADGAPFDRYIEIKPNGELKTAIAQTLHNELNECATMKTLRKDGCPFGYTPIFLLGEEPAITNISWAMESYPTIDDLQLNGTYSTRYDGRVKRVFEAPDDFNKDIRRIWTDYETFSVDGTYTIDGDKIRLHMDSYGSYY